MDYRVIPGILEKDWPVIEMKIQQVLPFAKAIHVDLIDGKFASNTTFLDPAPFKKYTYDIPFELHMMVEEPINYLKAWADAGFQRFIGHIEKMSDQVEFVARAQLLGEVGLGVDQDSQLDRIEVPFSDLDVLLFMTVKAGFSGEEFVEKDLDKIKIAREKSFIPIEVDGGINDQTILRAKESGADRFIATSFIFKETPQEQYKILHDKLFK